MNGSKLFNYIFLETNVHAVEHFLVTQNDNCTSAFKLQKHFLSFYPDAP